jgi:hypothetical protein
VDNDRTVRDRSQFEQSARPIFGDNGQDNDQGDAVAIRRLLRICAVLLLLGIGFVAGVIWAT